MAVYIGGFIMEIRSFLESSSDVVRNRAVPMADANIVLIPCRDLIVRQETIKVVAARLILSQR